MGKEIQLAKDGLRDGCGLPEDFMKYKILLLFAIWRALLFIVAGLSSLWLVFNPRFPYSDIYLVKSNLPKFLWSFANFDGVHYLTIIKQGYTAQFTQVFFPLYPMILRLFSSVFFGLNPILAGLIVTNVFFLIAIFVFAKLLKLDYKNRLVNWSVLFLLAFPTSFFFGSLYTESLFMLLVFTAFYCARKKKWWFAGILGGLASATRLTGIFLLPALLWERYHEIKNKNKNQTSNLHFLSSPVLYLAPLGLVAYMVYLQLTFGDWLYFWHAQPVFGAERSGQSIILLPQIIFRYVKIFFSVNFFSEAFRAALSEFLFTISAIFLLFIAHKKNIRASYLIFSWLSVIVPTLSGTFSSMPRYVLAAFPIYLVLSMIRTKYLRWLILIFNFILLIVFTALFTSGRWVA